MKWDLAAAAGAVGRFVLPQTLRDLAHGLPPALAIQDSNSRRSAERLYGGPIPTAPDYEPKGPHKVGILKDLAHCYVFNVLACRRLAVDYTVLDFEGVDWLDTLRRAQCDALLPWPSATTRWRNQVWEDRIRTVDRLLSIPIVPRWDELWLLDSKRRMAEWLQIRGIPAPRTWICLERQEAETVLDRTGLPIVTKTDAGASSNGVQILRSPRQARRMIHKAFGKGVRSRRSQFRDRQWGYVILQEFLPHHHEWRVVRIGDHYMCRKKTRVGDYASGTGMIGWALPPDGLLEFARFVTDLGRFESMALDIFENPNPGSPDRFLVNELQCLVGPIQRESGDDSAMGRWSYDPVRATWDFEPGFFYGNACADLRVQRLVDQLNESRHV